MDVKDFIRLHIYLHRSGLQSKKAVTAYSKSKQLLPSGFVDQSCWCALRSHCDFLKSHWELGLIEPETPGKAESWSNEIL